MKNYKILSINKRKTPSDKTYYIIKLQDVLEKEVQCLTFSRTKASTLNILKGKPKHELRAELRQGKDCLELHKVEITLN